MGNARQLASVYQPNIYYYAGSVFWLALGMAGKEKSRTLYTRKVCPGINFSRVWFPGNDVCLLLCCWRKSGAAHMANYDLPAPHYRCTLSQSCRSERRNQAFAQKISWANDGNLVYEHRLWQSYCRQNCRAVRRPGHSGRPVFTARPLLADRYDNCWWWFTAPAFQ